MVIFELRRVAMRRGGAFMGYACLAMFLSIIAAAPARAAEPLKKPTEADFYKIEQLNIPPSAFLEVGALEWLPDNKIAVASRRGEIWIVSDPAGKAPTWTRFAHGLHEVLGLAWKDGWL